MKLGARAHDYGKMSVKELIENIKNDGFESIQLAIPKAIEGIGNIYDVTPELIQEIKEKCEEEQIEIAVFGCYIEPSVLDDAKREAEVEKFLRGIDYAKALGAGCIGTETTRFAGDEEEREVAFEKLIDSVKKMVAKAEEVGIDVGIEPVSYHTLATPELTKRLLEAVDSPRLKVIFDPVNLTTAENIQDQEALWDECFQIFGDKICAMHIKGIKLGEDSQLEKTLLHEGHINYSRLLKQVASLHPNISFLREEAIPAMAKEDQSFLMKRLNQTL